MAVLICYDDSPSAKNAVEVAAATLGPKRAILLNVWNPPEAVLADAFGTESTSIPSIQDLGRLAEERAEQIVASGRELAGGLGLTVDARVERSRTTVWETILDVAEKTDAALIVIGTHGATAVQSAVLGSVSNAVVHHSSRPVLIVPATRQ